MFLVTSPSGYECGDWKGICGIGSTGILSFSTASVQYSLYVPDCAVVESNIKSMRGEITSKASACMSCAQYRNPDRVYCIHIQFSPWHDVHAFMANSQSWSSSVAPVNTYTLSWTIMILKDQGI